MSDRILVTGGAGYIGAQTAKALFQAGFTPVVYDNFSTGHPYAVKWGPSVQGDLCDTKLLIETISIYKPIAVIHFAADALVIESMQNPGKYYANNVSNTIHLLEAMRQTGLKKIVFSSSCAVYGKASHKPILEEDLKEPINPYGRSKLICETIMDDYKEAYGFEPVILRYFNAAGADLDTEIGENHAHETHLIPNIIQTALQIKEKFVVYGTDFGTKDGSAVRDFIHVQDLAEAHVKALQIGPQKINLGTGVGLSVFQILEEVQKQAQVTLKVELKKKREGEPASLTADYSKAKQMLNWEPKTSDVQTIVASAYKWHKFLHESAAKIEQALQTPLGKR